MESINWSELIPVIIPYLIALILAVLSYVLKMKKDSMTGLSKELTEFILAVYESAKDGKLTTQEIQKMLDELDDIPPELNKLLDS